MTKPADCSHAAGDSAAHDWRVALIQKLASIQKPDGSFVGQKNWMEDNPVLATSGGMIITQRDVDWQFASDAMVAEIAGVTPPTQADKDIFVRSLPAKFASMPKEQQEYLRTSQVRLADVHMNIDGTIKTRAAFEADIRRNVHSRQTYGAKRVRLRTTPSTERNTTNSIVRKCGVRSSKLSA